MIEVPAHLRHLDRDPRGYPIPVIVYRDHDGKAHFTINDEGLRDQVLRRDLCSLCGKKLTRGRWFVGGPLSAFHERGAFADPPMHHNCAHFALTVCPYLALAKYSGHINDKTLKHPTLLVDHTMIDERPALFICAMATGQTISERNVIPKRPWRWVEYWQHGKQMAEAEGKALVATIMAQPTPQPTTRGIFMAGER